jgi:lysyl-tRNA synthetase class 2
MDAFLDDPGQRAGFLLLAGFLLSFLFIRFSTRMMRNPKYPWWPGSIQTSGVHVHHLVFGIALMIATGFVGFAVQPEGVWMAILATLFGIGVGLTVDEFALWLYLEDVYWTDEGRSSVDVFVVCALVGGLVVLGVGAPFETEGGTIAVLLLGAQRLAWFALVLAKGKARLAVIGFFVPFVFDFAGIRLARPNSWWARRFYKPGSKKLARAEVRAARWDARRIKWLDRIGGAPHLERPSK